MNYCDYDAIEENVLRISHLANTVELALLAPEGEVSYAARKGIGWMVAEICKTSDQITGELAKRTIKPQLTLSLKKEYMNTFSAVDKNENVHDREMRYRRIFRVLPEAFEKLPTP